MATIDWGSLLSEMEEMMKEDERLAEASECNQRGKRRLEVKRERLQRSASADLSAAARGQLMRAQEQWERDSEQLERDQEYVLRARQEYKQRAAALDSRLGTCCKSLPKMKRSTVTRRMGRSSTSSSLPY